MAKRDIYHYPVRRALEKDGWTITHDPYRLEIGEKRLEADLGAERLISAEKGLKKIISATIHLDIRGDKIWIRNDHTEDGIATELVNAGVPREDIVLGFRHPKVRKYTDFADVAIADDTQAFHPAEQSLTPV